MAGLRLRALTAAVLSFAWVAGTGAEPGVGQKADEKAAVRNAEAPRAAITRYCLTCHNQSLKTGGLSLEPLDLKKVSGDAETWEKVVRKLRAGSMPPTGARRPDQATYDALSTFLETELDRGASASPGPAFVHRLNRAEYGNAIRDLLALDVDVNGLLPADDSSYGFDNIADQLRVSPALLERYLAAARKISALAVGNPAIDAASTTYRTAPDLTQTQHIEGLPLGTRGGLQIRHVFPVDGEYVIKPTLWRSNSGFLRGLMHPHQLEVSVDGARVHLAMVGGPADFAPLVTNPLDVEAVIDTRTQIRLPLTAGPHAVSVTFVEKAVVAPLDLLQPFQAALDPFDASGMPQIDAVTISGPFNGSGAGDTPSRRRVFVCRPTGPKDEESCARRVLATLVRRAYRRPATDADLDLLTGFYRIGRQKGRFEAGIELALRRILVDAEFVLRVERDPEAAPAGTIHRVTDLELASRLSFFLWSTIPDDELLELAVAGKLHQPDVLERQVRRMLADARSGALVSNFAGQWLYLRNLQSAAPDRILFPDFDDNLRQAFRREVELFFESVIREDRSVLDFLTADDTFVNERLARHYGIPNVYGSQFRRVVLQDHTRRGLLGKGAILTVTSHADRTSPVLRGKWILENLLGEPPAPPPPGIPPLAENSGRSRPLSVRAQMEEHRANPTCASCHKVLDPIGFALENFDATGAWRTRDAGAAIDASGQLADGTPVDGPATLLASLRPPLFLRTMTEKLLTYAVGRGLTYEDAPVVRAILRDAAGHSNRFSSLVLAIVRSVPFQMRIKPKDAADVAAIDAASSGNRTTR